MYEEDEILDTCVDLLADELQEELEEDLESVNRRRRFWVSPWVARRDEQGASSSLLQEWAEETPEDYRNHLRVDREQFEFLLGRVGPVIQRKDTRFRDAIPARVKLQMTLRYLATGDNFRTLSALYRVPKSTFSAFLPEVCEAIYSALEEFIQVGMRDHKFSVHTLCDWWRWHSATHMQNTHSSTSTRSSRCLVCYKITHFSADHGK